MNWQMWLGHVHGSSQSGISKLGGWLLKVLTFARVRNLIDLLGFNIWIMRCVGLLCHHF